MEQLLDGREFAERIRRIGIITHMELLNSEEMPEGLSYPVALHRLVERGLTHIEPWFVLDASEARNKMAGLRERYPERWLLPFAKREDNDDVACFDRALPGKVVIVHDFASRGWEDCGVLDDFYAWVRKAVDDMIEFDSLEDEEWASGGA